MPWYAPPSLSPRFLTEEYPSPQGLPLTQSLCRTEYHQAPGDTGSFPSVKHPDTVCAPVSMLLNNHIMPLSSPIYIPLLVSARAALRHISPDLTPGCYFFHFIIFHVKRKPVLLTKFSLVKAYSLSYNNHIRQFREEYGFRLYRRCPVSHLLSREHAPAGGYIFVLTGKIK